MRFSSFVCGSLVVCLVSILSGCAKQTAFWANHDSQHGVSFNAGDILAANELRESGRGDTNDIWLPLTRQLAEDGLRGPKVDALIATLDAVPTQSPMGRKIRELYKKQILQKKRPGKQLRHFQGVVTLTNAQTCQNFIAIHKVSFDEAEKKYGVPAHVAAALLFVETRLGKVLGDVPENAFYTLASMSMCRDAQSISSWLPQMPGYEKHLDWMNATMNKRANWAYTEVRALVRYMVDNDIQPQDLPGSIYGAVGLCQFMPSNITVYGEDGDSDGKIDLFTVPDAVASLSKYLYQHGWRRGMSYKQQHKILMTYNHSATYANTILDLGLMIAGKKSTLPDSPRGAAL